MIERRVRGNLPPRLLNSQNYQALTLYPVPDLDCQLRFTSMNITTASIALSLKLPNRARGYKCPFCPKTYRKVITNTHKPKLPGSADCNGTQTAFSSSSNNCEQPQSIKTKAARNRHLILPPPPPLNKTLTLPALRYFPPHLSTAKSESITFTRKHGSMGAMGAIRAYNRLDYLDQLRSASCSALNTPLPKSTDIRSETTYLSSTWKDISSTNDQCMRIRVFSKDCI